MKLSEIQKICSDFNPVRRPDDGKLTCKHKLADDLCTKENHFVCDVVSKRKAPDKYISVSRIKLYEECPRKWALKYFYKVEPPTTPKWKTVGSAFAMARAKIDQGQTWSIPPEVEDLDRVRLRAVLRGYSRLPRLAASNEEQAFRPLPGISGLWLMGYLDGLSADGKIIYEWKYADPSGYNTLSMQMQGGSYLWLKPEAESLMLCIAKKPSRFKLKKGEDMQGFEARLNDEIDKNFRQWFTFREFFRGEFNYEHLTDHLETVYRQSEIARSHGELASNFLPHYGSCSIFAGCDWKSYCERHTGSGIGCKSEKCSHPDICGVINKISL